MTTTGGRLGRHGSTWLRDEGERTRRPALRGHRRVDVVVIGAGITGLSTALRLADAGNEVVVVDRGGIGSGTTGHSTAKVTSQHGLTYGPLLDRYGEDAIRVYAQANEGAKEWIAQQAGSIECGFRRRDAWVYATGEDDRELIESETHAARLAGLPAAFEESVPLPFPTAGGMVFRDQAEFDPQRYVLGLADRFEELGGTIHEDSPAVSLHDGSPVRAETEQGSIEAAHAVVATLIPFPDRGGFFARAFPTRSYCITASLAGGQPPTAMLITAEPPMRSIRAVSDGGRDLLMVGGESHDTGTRDAAPERYEQLAAFARRHWDVEAIEHHWSAQDFSASDSVPYAGPLHRFTDRIWIATGLKKWGITGGTAAAAIISDGIAGDRNPAADLFSSTRFSVRELPKLAAENLKVSLHFAGDRIRDRGGRPLADLAPGEGAIVSGRSGKVAGFRDDDGLLHAVSARCTHLYCQVVWNGAERTWDCPCHGSRFSVDGDVLNGPAVDPLPPRPAD